MLKEFDVIVYIGRFQPLHNAHVEIIKQAALLSRKLIIIVGSSNLPRTFKNPFTVNERIEMIDNSCRKICENNDCELLFSSLRDTIYNDQAWLVKVQDIVSSHTNSNDNIGIIGHEKDESTFYLRQFPQWKLIHQDLIEPLSATQIRDFYFKTDANLKFLAHVVPPHTLYFLENFRKTDEYNQIINERNFIAKYKKQYENLPYSPIFVTVDAMVIQSGHILMIKRRSEPGKGLWALPGGFVNANTDKSIEDAMIRELKEETGIKVPEKVLRGSIENIKVFDAIDRSSRGRTITHAFKISFLEGEWNLPKIKGSDDAEKAKWIPISQICSEECFEDHYDIIQYFLGD